MANRLAFYVDIETGSLKLAQQDIKKLSAQIDGVGAAHRRASREADTHFHKQDKGIIGTANSSRSFSKLAQSIDGDNNSLVGAYAALAANIFAVTAAFAALKSAAEVEQVIEGLAASGARLGLSYKNAIVEVRNASEGLLTLEQSARSTAQVLAAGFKTDQLVRITKAAKDASFALGRDMSESMDRLTRGVIKLEPELLDELGIMVRLDEASANYARSLGKSASALTATEKRQGFFNATMAEVEAKFGGLATGADTSAAALNKLSAVFGDLSKTVFSVLNTIFVPFAKIFSSSPAALLGGMLLFASSIKGQLMPALTDAADRMQKLAEKSAKLSGITATNIIENARGPAAGKGSSAVTKYFNAVKEGQGTLEQTRAAQERLNTAIEKGRDEKGRIISTLAYKKQLDGLREIESAQLRTGAATNKANAANAASMGNYSSAVRFTSASIQDYAAHVRVANAKTGLLGTISRGTSISMYALSASAKVAGVAFLNFLPWLGLIVAALGLLYSGVIKLAGEGYTKLTEATKAYNEVLKTSRVSLEQYNKLNESTASAFTRVTSQAKIAGNSVTSLAQAFKEVQKAQASNSGFGKFLSRVKEIFNFSRASDLSKISQSTGLTSDVIDKNYELIKTFMEMSKYKGSKGIIAEIFGKEGPKTVDDYIVAVALLEERFSSLAATTETLEAAFKAADIASSDFIKSATPTTPFDGLAESIYNVNTSLSAYRDEVNKGTATAEDYKSLISGIPGGVKQLLGGSLEQTLKTPGGANIVQEELIGLQEKFDLQRKISLEYSGQLAIAQAIVTVANKSTAITGAEVAFKINAENRVIALQVAQLNAQKAILDMIIAQNKSKIDALDLDKRSLDLLKEKSELELISANQAEIASPGVSATRKAQLEEENKKLRDRQELLRANANAQSASNNLASQATAMAMTATTTTQKNAAIAKASADNEVFKAQQILKTRESLVAKKMHEAEIQEIIFGFSSKDSVLEEAKLEVYKQKVDIAKKESKAREAEYLLQASLSQTAANRAEFEKRARQEREELLPLVEKELQREYDLNRIKSAGFKTESERLSTAKNLLDIQLQQAEAIASTAEAQAALNIRQKRFEAGSRQLTATEERQLAFEAAEAALDAALATQELKANGIKAEYALLDAQYALEQIKLDNATKALARLKPSLSGDELVAVDANIVANMQALDAYAAIRKNLGAQETAALDLLAINIANLRLAVQETGTVGALSGQTRTFSATSTLGEKGNLGFNKETILALSEDLSPFIEDLKKLGPQGEYVSAVVEGALIIADSFRRIGDAGLTSAEGLSAVGSIIGQVAKIAQSSAQAKIAAVDQEIAAEQKRDGKSSESLARIQAMEKKKDSIAKKAFETNKKLQMAQTVVNTASAVVGALAQLPFPANIAMAAMLGALGAAQLGIISGTSYQSSSTAASVATPSAVSVGKRSDSVDLARSNSTPGGELGYLTGAQGTGNTSANFRPRAYGGYGHAGMIVGEKGPEIFTPSVPGQVTPNDKVQGQQVVPVNFHINAIDAEGVEQVLTNQRGHIIGMLREAANANGERFLENVDTAKYARRGGRRL